MSEHHDDDQAERDALGFTVSSRDIESHPTRSLRARDHLVGRRVEFLGFGGEPDPYTRLREGDRGTVVHVDDPGTIHVKWDSGSSLGLIPKAGDRFRVIEEDR